VGFRAGVVALLAVLFMAMAPFAQAEGPRQDSFIARAVFASGKLWLLSDHGALFSVEEGVAEKAALALPDPASDLWVEDGAPAIVTCPRICLWWTVRRWDHGAWTSEALIWRGGDKIVGVERSGSVTVILTTSRIIELVGKKHTDIPLKETGAANRGTVSTLYITPQSILVGLNKGEWGGGLWRLDRRTGVASPIERRDGSSEPCGGVLNSSCDPVNGIAAEPWKPDCFAVAVGLIHFMASGRIAEICGDHVERLYPRSGSKSEQNESTAFFGVARCGAALCAVGNDGFYRFDSPTAYKHNAFPPFKDYGGFQVSFALADVVLVLTDINRRHAMSGATPLLIPR
jgi:hypothetical protein